MKTRSSSFGRWVALLLAVAIGALGAVLVMRWLPRSGDKATTEATGQFYCPMHPSYVSDVPGDCPVCSMKLVPLTGAPGPPSASMTPGGAASPTGASGPSLFVPQERQQQIGVKFAEVRRMAVTTTLRLPGRVAIDERQIAHVHSRVAGFIEEVFVNYTGAPVRHGEPLFTIYSPEILATQQDLLTAITTAQRLRTGMLSDTADDADALVESARKRLRLWGMSPDQIARVERTREPIRAVTIVSPVSGIVTEREAFHHGRAVTPDLDLYMIVDFSSVWVLAQVGENDVGHVQLGDLATIELPGGGTLEAPVSYIAPMIDTMTRSATVRLDVPNASLSLKVDMLVSVALHEELGEQLVVPASAVLDTGTSRHAFVDLGSGYLQPRLVAVGPETDEGRVITLGLAEGERVVTSAAFLIDAESSIKGALDEMGSPTADGGANAGAVQASANALDVHLDTDPSPPRTGRNTVRVVVHDAQGKFLDDATVRVRIFMPQMGSMAPMESVATLDSRGRGRYDGALDIPMAFSWQATVTVEKDGAVLGRVESVLSSR